MKRGTGSGERGTSNSRHAACSVFRFPFSVFRFPFSLFPVPCSLFPVPWSLFPVPCSPFPVPHENPMSNETHIIKSYDGELTRLTGEIVRMGELSVKQLEAAIDVVERRDERAAQRVVDNDDAIDEMEQQVSHDVVRLLALRAPMAGDLRNVFAALRTAADIERIGDYAANVAKRSIPLSMVAPVQPAAGLEYLAKLAAIGVRDVLAAYSERDAERARAVWKNDTVLDEAYTGYFRQLLTYMMEDPRNITPCTHLLFMAKNIERIGDHATNIAENVWFQVTGESLPAQRRKLDRTASADFSGPAAAPERR
jgi:phosphate transport system protein